MNWWGVGVALGPCRTAGNLYLHKLKHLGPLVRLDGVGGAVLLVDADLHRWVVCARATHTMHPQMEGPKRVRGQPP